MSALGPESITCGPATASVRALAAASKRIEWFVRSTTDHRWSRSVMEEHLRRVRHADPSKSPALVEITHHVGGWEELEKLAAAVRPPQSAYDWKFGVLKPLGRAHSERLGWTALAHARAHQPPEPRETDMFVVIGQNAYWNGLAQSALFPRVGDVSRAGKATETARWYASFSCQDVIEAVEWQLAKGNDDTSDNPFTPLFELYAAAVYPFALSADRMALLHFAPDPA